MSLPCLALLLQLLAPHGGPAYGGGRLHDIEPPPAAPRPKVSFSADFDEPRLIARLEELMQGALPIYEEATGHALLPERPLVFNLFHSIQNYRRAAGAVGVSGSMGVGAVTAWGTHESYLAIQPRRDQAYLEAVGWQPDLLVQLLLHEGVHQHMARSGMYPTVVLPPWYSEGYADYVAERAMHELLEPTEHGWLMLDDARFQVARAVDEGRAIPLADLFRLGFTEIDRRADRALFYDQSRDVVAFLSEGPVEHWRDAFESYLTEIDGLERPDLPRDARRLTELHRERWLEIVGDVEALERDWKASVTPIEAPWIEVLGSSQWNGDELLTAALSWRNDGYVIAGEPAPEAPTRFSAEVDVLGVGKGDAYVVLHSRSDPAGGLRITLREGAGSLSVVAWKENNVRQQGFEVPALVAPEGFVRLTVDIDGPRLTIRVGEDPPIEASVPDGFPTPGGTWGLGAWRDAARWRDVSYR